MEVTHKRRWLRFPSPAMIVACAALFVALGGTSYAVVTLGPDSVGTDNLKDGAVTNAKIAAGSVSAGKLVGNAVTNAKVRNGAISSSKLQNGSVTNAKLGDGSITTVKLKNGAVSNDKLQNGVVTPKKLFNVPGARVRRTTALSVPTATMTLLHFDTAGFNVGGVWKSGSSDRLSVPTAGRYLVTATARWASNTTGRRTLVISRNAGAGELAFNNVSAYSSAAFEPQQSATAVCELDNGDFVQAWVYQDSGAPLALDTTTATGVTFTLQWIAP